MSEVLAALDCSLAARPVLVTAKALGKALGADVAAIHVGEVAPETPRGLAAAAGVPLSVVPGAVVERLVAASQADAVVALVIGARGIPTDPRPLGATAVSVATSVHKPVVVVPPDAARPAVNRILVPLEGNVSTSAAPQVLLELTPETMLEVIALHVVAPDAIPAFTDQPLHEQEASAKEFLARYCPWGIAGVRLETRVGRREEQVARTAHECGCDMIVLGWSQRLSEDRARVVSGTLQRSDIPVMLFPVTVEG